MSYLDPSTYKLAFVMETLSQHTKIPKEDFRKVRSFNGLFEMVTQESANLRRTDSLPVMVQTPIGTVDFKFNRPPGSRVDRYIGLCEFIIWHPDESKKPPHERDVVKFWQWYMDDDFEHSFLVHFVHKNDLRKFYKIVIALQRKPNKKIKPPILPKRTLAEIYDNSIGFLLRSRSLRTVYDEFNIPFKRGILLCGKYGCGKCLNVNTLVFTSGGIKPIGSFLSDEEPDEASDKKVKIYGLKGIESTEQIYNGGFQPSKIITSHYGFKTESTPNHKFVCSDGKQITWKRADELKDGDFIAIPRNMRLFGNETSLEEFYFECNEKLQTRLPKIMSTDFAYFLGLILGDGCLTVKNRVLFSTIDLTDTYSDLVKSLFNIQVYLKTDNRSTKNLVSLDFSSVRVKKFLNLLGIGNVNACQKEIPECVLNAPQEIVRAFLQGLFDTDGWSDSTGRIGFDSCSEKLTRCVHLILTNFGIISYLRKRKNNFSNAWSIDMTGANARKFYEEIGFRLKRKQDNYFGLSDKHHPIADIVPYNPELIDAITSSLGIRSKFRPYIDGGSKMTRTKVAEIIVYAKAKGAEDKCEALLDLSREDIFWDVVKNIKDSNCQVADFYIPETHSFAAGGFFNHNTLTCKWLRYLCQKHNLGYKIVTMPQYDRARANDQVASLFKMPKSQPGIIFFDDMDVMVKDRKTSSNFELQTFLSQLDGIIPSEGVVYIFTTNYVQELDPAFVRPGRIDLFLTFRTPSEALRREFIEKTFHAELLKLIDVDDFLKRTDEFTFAELEEVRKLLSMDFIRDNAISVENTFSVFNGHRKEFEDRAAVGFNQKMDEEPNNDSDLRALMRTFNLEGDNDL